MGFRLVPNSVTLSNLERRKGRYVALFYQNLQLSGRITSKWLKTAMRQKLRQKCSTKNLVLAIHGLWQYWRKLPRRSAL